MEFAKNPLPPNPTPGGIQYPVQSPYGTQPAAEPEKKSGRGIIGLIISLVMIVGAFFVGYHFEKLKKMLNKPKAPQPTPKTVADIQDIEEKPKAEEPDILTQHQEFRDTSMELIQSPKKLFEIIPDKVPTPPGVYIDPDVSGKEDEDENP